MFTGLVEEVTTIQVLVNHGSGARLFLLCEKILDDLKIGDSVAINGACQTVVSIEGNKVCFEAAQETLKLTNLSELKQGDKVNLERAMKASDRFGGHFVSGHIDGIGKFLKKEFDGMAYICYFEAPKDIAKYIVKKGSVCINGVSLTVADIKDNNFTISVIPHTIENTNLKDLKPYSNVNLEADMLAKYVEKFTTSSDNTGITEEFLRKHGF